MAKLIGKGTFTRAYLLENNRVLLRSNDPIKECMAHGWFPESRLFPVVDQVDDGVYEMEYFPRTSSLKNALAPREYALYQLLKTFADVTHTRACHSRDALRHGILHETISEFSEANGEYAEEFQAIAEAVDACGNYGTDIGFEISPRNVAVKDGQLILLDCFFIMSALKAARK